jgi:quercetin dioxygenase-like cupin family protein
LGTSRHAFAFFAVQAFSQAPYREELVSIQTFFDLPAVSAERAQAQKLYLEFLRVPALSAGVYVLPAGGTDPQQPHQQDEVYYVVRGRAKMRVADQEQVVKPGTVIFVPAEVEHRFFDIAEELEVLVLFAPAESE